MAGDPAVARFLAQLEEAPDPHDRAQLTVLADLLQERGDPRGELMALQLAPAAVSAAHADRIAALLEALSPGRANLRWGVGFVRKLDLTFTDEFAAYARALLRHDSVRLLRELEITIYDGYRADLLAPALPPALRALSVRGDLTSAPRLVDAAQNLGALELYGPHWFEVLRHPRLTELRLGREAEDALVTTTTDDLPAVRTLALLHGTGTVEPVALLARSGLLGQVDRLHLHLTTMTAADVAALAARASRPFASLHVAADHLPPAAREALAPAAIELTLSRRPPR